MEVEYTEAEQTNIQLSVLCLKCFKVVLLLFFFFFFVRLKVNFKYVKYLH